MRSLIVGGGTGGHIYPALAVARSLRGRPDAPELRWLGGHRGLEATLVPPSGIPHAPARGALAAHDRARRPRRARPDPPRRLGAAGDRHARRGAPGGHLHDRRLRGDPGADGRGRACASRSSCGTATSSPGRSVRATARLADGARGLVRGDLRRAPRRRARRCPCYLTGTPIRDTRDVDREAARDAAGRPRPASACCWSSAARRPSAGSTPRSSGAIGRLVERVTVIHVTGDEAYAAALADREALPGRPARPLPAVPVPARRHAAGARRGGPRGRAGPAPRPWPRSPPSASR